MWSPYDYQHRGTKGLHTVRTKESSHCWNEDQYRRISKCFSVLVTNREVIDEK